MPYIHHVHVSEPNMAKFGTRVSLYSDSVFTHMWEFKFSADLAVRKWSLVEVGRISTSCISYSIDYVESVARLDCDSPLLFNGSGSQVVAMQKTRVPDNGVRYVPKGGASWPCFSNIFSFIFYQWALSRSLPSQWTTTSNKQNLMSIHERRRSHSHLAFTSAGAWRTSQWCSTVRFGGKKGDWANWGGYRSNAWVCLHQPMFTELRGFRSSSWWGHVREERLLLWHTFFMVFNDLFWQDGCKLRSRTEKWRWNGHDESPFFRRLSRCNLWSAERKRYEGRPQLNDVIVVAESSTIYRKVAVFQVTGALVAKLQNTYTCG